MCPRRQDLTPIYEHKSFFLPEVKKDLSQGHAISEKSLLSVNHTTKTIYHHHHHHHQRASASFSHLTSTFIQCLSCIYLTVDQKKSWGNYLSQHIQHMLQSSFSQTQERSL